MSEPTPDPELAPPTDDKEALLLSNLDKTILALDMTIRAANQSLRAAQEYRDQLREERLKNGG